MKATIEQRLAELDNTPATRENLLGYLDVIRANVKTSADLIDRRLALLLLTAFTLELSTQPGTAEASLLGVKLHDLTLVQKLLPIVIGYFYYSVLNAVNYRLILRQTHKQVMERTSSPLSSVGLEALALPPGLFQVEVILLTLAEGALLRPARFLFMTAIFVTAFGPATYIGFAVFRLFRRYGVTDPVVWLSALTTTFFLALVFVMVRLSNRLVRRSATTGSASTAAVLSAKGAPGEYDCEAYRYRDLGLYILVVQGDIDHAVELFKEMEQRSAHPAMGLLMTLERAFRKEEEDTRQAQLIRQVLDDAALEKLDSAMGRELVDFVRFERELYHRRHSGPRLDSETLARIEKSMGKDTMEKLFARNASG